MCYGCSGAGMLHLVYHKADVPSTRIRLQQMIPFLEARNVRCRLVANPRTRDERVRRAREFDRGDVVLIHRVRPTREEASWWSSLPVVRIYDFDDAIMFGRVGGWAGWLQTRSRRAAFRRMQRICDGFLCGNAYLASQCSGGGRRVGVLPSPVPVSVPQHEVRTLDEASDSFRIGWVGRASNLAYLRALEPALAAVARERQVVVVALSDGPLALSGTPVENIVWSETGEAAEIARFDAGIMPLDLDGPWVRGKCAYKLLQYMSAGVPAVGTRVGMNAELIRDGENGLLATDPHDWIAAILRLVDDRSLRTRLGAAGRSTVLAGFTYEVIADRLVAFLSQVVSGNNAS